MSFFLPVSFFFTDVDAHLSSFEADLGDWICFTGPRVHKVPSSDSDRFVFFCTWAATSQEEYNRERTTWAITIASESALCQEIVKHFRLLGLERAKVMFAACPNEGMKKLVEIFFSSKSSIAQLSFVEKHWSM